MTAIVRAGTLLVVLAVLSPSLAQTSLGPRTAVPGVAEAARFRLLTDNRPAQVLEATREHLPDANWDQIVPALQSVFDHGDALITVRGEAVLTTARAEALRLFEELPAAGQEAYRKRYEPVARALLETARKTDDPKQLLEVLARYEVTPAATTALELLGTHLAKSGRDGEAAAAFVRLKKRLALEKWPAGTIYRAAKSLARTEDTPFARQVGKRLLELAAKEEVTIDGAKLKPADLETALKSWRTEAEVGLPMPVPLWLRKPDLPPDLALLLSNATTALKKRGAMVPAISRPTVLRATIDGKQRTAVVARTFEGVQCLDAAKGALLWQVPLREDLATWMGDPQRKGIAQQWLATHGPDSTVAFDNTRTGRFTVGAGHVFIVDDVPFLEKPQAFGAFPGAPPVRTLDSARRNLLLAISLGTGKLMWEAGGKAMPELDNGWFLGAPLVLGDTVLALHEKAHELRLVRLAAKTGKVLEIRVLGGLSQLPSEGDERSRGFQMTLARGHLLVPTGCGTLLALELPALSPGWVYEYAEAPEPGPVQPIRPFPLPIPAAPPKPRPGYGYEPLAEGDLVVYSAPDSRRIHGLDVATGQKRWTVNCDDGDRVVGPLLPAGLVVLGNTSLRLLNRATGATIWRLPVAVPVGQGYAAGTRYVQPVVGEFLVIDLQRGAIAARLRTPDRVPEGNLVPGRDGIVAAGPSGLALLSPLESERRRLEKEADRPDGQPARVRLAELELQLGKTDAALATIRKALAGKPEGAIVVKGQALLFRILTAHLQAVPGDLDKYQKEYYDLAAVFIPLDAPTQLQKKLIDLRQERMRTALPVLAESCLHARRPREAVQMALELATLAGPDLIDNPDGDHRVARSVFAARMIRLASEVNATATDIALEERTKPLLKEPVNLAALRKLLEAVPLRGFGDDLRLRVARGLLASDPAGADRLLARLTLLAGPVVRPRAFNERFRLAVKESRFTDAVALAREMAAKYPDTVVTPPDAEKKETGKEVLDGLAADNRFVPVLETPKPARKWQVTETAAAPAPALPFRPCILPAGTGLPSENEVFQVDVTASRMRFFDAATGKEVATVAQGTNRFQAEMQGLLPYQLPVRSTSAGRILLLSLAEQLVALDPVARQVLWTRDRLERSQPNGGATILPWVNQRLGWYQLRHFEGWVQIQGAPVAHLGNVVATPTQRGIEGLDVDTGRVLWQRRDLTTPAVLLVVAGKLLAIEYDGSTVKATRWLRIEDGGTTTGPDLVDAFAGATQVHAGRLLAQSANASPVLRVVDMATGRETWRKELPADSVILDSKVPGVFGWVEPKGATHLLDLATRAELVSHTLEADLRGIVSGTVLADGRNYYLLTRISPPALPRPGMRPGSTGFAQTLPVEAALGTGHLIAFDRASKKMVWYTETPGLYLALPVEDVPVLMLSATRFGAGPAGIATELRLLDRRTGKLVFDRTMPTFEQLSQLRWQPREATLELFGQTRRLKIVGE